MMDYYICKYHINAKHSRNNSRENIHGHTFNISVYIGKHNEPEDFDINAADKLAKDYFEGFSGKYLNAMDVFEDGRADIEDIAEVFFRELKKLFKDTTYTIYQVDVSDNLLYKYQVSDQILLPIINLENSIENYDTLIAQKELIREKEN